MIGGKDVRQRYAMGAASGGDFGISNPWRTGSPHPDGAPKASTLDDGERGVRPAIMHTKGMHGAQAAPDHGPHFANYGK